MAKIMDKVLGFMGFEEEEIEVYDETPQYTDESQKKKKGALFGLPTQKQMRVIVMEPTKIDDVQGIVDNLKNRRSVIVNLENADKELARRVVDFISGATYALNGTIEKIGTDIFIFVPSNVDVTSELRTQEKDKDNKGIFNWGH